MSDPTGNPGSAASGSLAAVFDRALGAYLGLAIGDALGATVEFMRPREIRAQYGVHRDIIGGGWLKLPAGQVTDDTTMSLALGDALLKAGPQAVRQFSPWPAADQALAARSLKPAANRRQAPAALAEEALEIPAATPAPLMSTPPEENEEQLAARQTLGRAVGDAFVAWLRSKPVDCGNTCRRGILRYMHQGTFLGPLNEGDAGNGAVMRNLPVVLASLWDDERWASISLLQARLTHHHPLSDLATLALSHMARQLILGQSVQQVLQWADDWVVQHPVFRFVPYPGRASAYVVDTVQTVLHHFAAEHDDMSAALIATVNQGEDADTTGALVGMLAGAACGAQALPRQWLRRLNSATVAAITEQTSALLALAAQAGSPPVAQTQVSEQAAGLGESLTAGPGRAGDSADSAPSGRQRGDSRGDSNKPPPGLPPLPPGLPA